MLGSLDTATLQLLKVHAGNVIQRTSYPHLQQWWDLVESKVQNVNTYVQNSDHENLDSAPSDFVGVITL